MTAKEYLKNFRAGDLRALGRLISLAENQDPIVWEVLAELYSGVGKAKCIGFTGLPGAGKSTLIGGLVRFMRQKGKRVGVIAVDPISPFTGGAILGDRIRLVDHFNDPGVFIRSLSTRGKLGGLSLATRQVAQLMDAFGFDVVLIESVGVGQSEVDIRKIADINLVVVVPDWGDGIQTLKAGILEIADAFVVNKADREGADRVVSELKAMLQMTEREAVAVHLTSSSEPKSLDNLFVSIESFFEKHPEKITKRRMEAKEEILVEILDTMVLQEVRAWV